MDNAMIEFQSVTKQYQGGHPAVDQLSMSIDKGSITDFTSVPAAELRRSMGYVMQSSGLMPHRCLAGPPLNPKVASRPLPISQLPRLRQLVQGGTP